MKNIHILKGLFLLFLTFQFVSCDNEPLGDNYFADPDPNPNDSTAIYSFKAIIDGTLYETNNAHGLLSEDNVLVIKAVHPHTAETIKIRIMDAIPDRYELNTSSNNLNIGYYQRNSQDTNPYITLEEMGGEGDLFLTIMDPYAQNITGRFYFKAMREEVDENGDPILDADGNPVIGMVDITDGEFNGIPLMNGEDDDFGDGVDIPVEEFFAKVNDNSFIARSLDISEPLVGGIEMLKIEARDSLNNQIRIDIPKSFGVGVYDMAQISDGTKLTAIYKMPGITPLTSNPGVLEITLFDKVEGILEANFHFTANDPFEEDPTVMEVTEGQIRVFFEGVPEPESYFVAVVDGEEYIPQEIDVTEEMFNGYRRYVVTTTMGAQKMVLNFSRALEEDTYEMTIEINDGTEEAMGVYTPRVGSTISYYSEEGEFTVELYDRPNKLIEGTFNFVAVDRTGRDTNEYVVNGGVFSLILP